MNETDMQAAVNDMLVELMQEGIAVSGNYIDADTGLLMCGRCRTKKQTVVKLMGRTMKPPCLCRCKSEELEKEEQKRKDKELMEGILRNFRKRGRGCCSGAMWERERLFLQAVLQMRLWRRMYLC